jgi:phage FluMu protein Com
MSSTTTEAIMMRSKTYLNTFCPYCSKSLNENNTVRFRITDPMGDEGDLMLSPYLNVFTNESTIKVPDKVSLRDIRCFHCGKSLIVEDRRCPDCGSRIAGIKILAINNRIDFYICSMKGCIWHGLNEKDVQDVILEDSEEW